MKYHYPYKKTRRNLLIYSLFIIGFILMASWYYFSDIGDTSKFILTLLIIFLWEFYIYSNEVMIQPLVFRIGVLYEENNMLDKLKKQRR